MIFERKGYLIIISIALFISIVFISIVIFKIRNRPNVELTSYLDETYPVVNSNEAKKACDEFKTDLEKLLKFVLQNDNPQSDSAAFKFLKSNSNQTLILTNSELFKKYHITDPSDQKKVQEYIGNAMQYEVTILQRYLGDPQAERNFLEKYLYFDFPTLKY